MFPDRFAAFPGDAIAFYESLSPADRDVVDYLIRAVVEAVAAPAQDDPQCPRRCDVATRPEAAGRGRFVCSSCGSEFEWPTIHAADPGVHH